MLIWPNSVVNHDTKDEQDSNSETFKFTLPLRSTMSYAQTSAKVTSAETESHTREPSYES